MDKIEIPDEIINTLEYNILMDLKKTDLSKSDRKILLTDYMRRHNIDMATLARTLGIPKTTLYYWIETEKKKEQTARYDLSTHNHNLVVDLNLIQHKLEIYRDQIKNGKFKINDNIRRKIMEIKDLFVWISFNTTIIHEKIR